MDTSLLVASLVLVGQRRLEKADPAVGIPNFIAAAILAALLFFAFRALRKSWTIADVPTSKVKGVFVGLNEVTGVAETPSMLAGYFTKTPCVWFKWQVDELQLRVRSSTWVRIDGGGGNQPFILRDDSGAMWVNPVGADLDGEQTISAEGHNYPNEDMGFFEGLGKRRRRFTEWVIRPGEELYVLGPAQIHPTGGSLYFAATDADNKRTKNSHYLISRDSETKVRRRSTAIAAILMLLSIGLAPIIATVRSRDVPNEEDDELLFVAGSGNILIWFPIFLIVSFLFIALVMRAYNRLVTVKNRAEFAWGLIDTQLQRRNDLIPNVIAAVKAYSAHEAETLEGVTTARYQALEDATHLPSKAALDNAGTAVESQQHVEKSAFAIAEAYPDLKASENFLHLQHMLEDTEDRVALARSFYNDSINVLLDRKGTFPYIFLTPLLHIPSFQLFAADFNAREYVPRIDLADPPTVVEEISPPPTEGSP